MECRWSSDSEDACPYCTGEACAQCPDLPRLDGPDCEHDVAQRHEYESAAFAAERQGGTEE